MVIRQLKSLGTPKPDETSKLLTVAVFTLLVLDI
jgi:hypothetical protein